jgi:hypothetical protein
VTERFALLGLAAPRAPWFRAVAQWATSGALPAEFVKAVSADEVRARLAQGRPWSAVLLDAEVSAVDRDLVDDARTAGAVVIVVQTGRVARDWSGLGATAVLPPDLTREQVLDVLASHARRVGRASRPRDGIDGRGGVAGDPAGALEPAAPLVAVCGPGGTGASTVAMALAQALAGVPAGHPAAVVPRRPVVLADFCRRAQQAVLHDTGEVVPGVHELVDAHRHGAPTPAEVAALTFAIDRRGYQLLLGLRRPRYWSALRPRSFEAAVEGLRRSFGAVVCDVDGDLEGESAAGSLDVEERNVMSRTAVAVADVVLAVGRPGIKGLHSLAWLLHDLVEVDVPGERILPVLNAAPRSPRLRAQLQGALHELVQDLPATIGPALFLPRRPVEAALRDGAPVPTPLPALVLGAYAATRQRVGARRNLLSSTVDARAPVTPGSLGVPAEADGEG